MRLVELLRGSDPARAFPGASPDLEVERSVWDRLYGDRAEVTATPIPHGAAPLGRLVGGRYRLVERLGAGGMAIVYRARDEQLERDVAVKVIGERHARNPLFVRRFRREAQLGARLAHPNIVAVLDAGAQPRDFIVTELVLGLDAGTLLHRRGRLTAGEAVDIVAQVCDALTHAHGRDVVHRDVSPSNILIAEADGTVKLADFGLASDALESPDGRVHGVTGTLGYLAPEIVRGARPSPRSDVHSLGAVAYRLLVGPEVPPADPGGTAPLTTAVPRMPPLSDARPGLPRGLYAAVQQALAPEPDARQESVAEFHAQLLDGHTPSRGQRGGVMRFPDAVRSQLRSAA
jgi:eukaryotic-like serine/threonine-protein kinase